LFVSDPVVASRLSAMALVNAAVNSPAWTAVQPLADRLGVTLADMAFGVFGAGIVIIAGLVWRRTRARAVK
jgi:hypothetical protein